MVESKQSKWRHEFVDPFKIKTEVKEVILTVPIATGIFTGIR